MNLMFPGASRNDSATECFGDLVNEFYKDPLTEEKVMEH